MNKKNSSSSALKVKSTAHIDWGLLAAIIAIIQATMSSLSMRSAANSTAFQVMFTVGVALGAAAALGAIIAFVKKLRGNDPAPRLGIILLLGFILAAIIISFLDPALSSAGVHENLSTR